MNLNRSNSSPIMILWFMYALIFLVNLAYFVLLPDLSSFAQAQNQAQNLHQEVSIFAIIMGSGAIIGTVVSPFFGHLADRLGRRNMLIFTASLLCIGYVLCALGLHFKSILLITIGYGINMLTTTIQPIAQAVIADVSKQVSQKAKRYGINSFVIALSMITGPALSAWLDHLGVHSIWLSAFMLVAYLTAAVVILMYYYLPETLAVDFKSSKLNFMELNQSLRLFIRLKPKVIAILLMYFFASLAWAQYFQYIGIFLHQKLHFSNEMLNQFFSFLGFYLILGLVVFYPFLLKLKSLLKACTVCLVFVFIGLGLVSVFAINWVQWLAIIPAAIGMACLFPLVLTLISESQNSQHQGWILGVLGFAGGIVWSIVSFTPALFAHVGVNSPLIGALLMVLTALIINSVTTYRLSQ